MKENKPIKNKFVAIIGMGCLFPKSFGIKEYWRLLFQGEDAITDIPPTHWSVDDYFHKNPKEPDHTYCKRGGFLTPISYDPTEFGIPPNCLEATDTSQLLSLVVAKMALEDAGYGDSRPFDHKRTSVILGVTGTQELVIPLGARLGHPIWKKALEESGVPPQQTEEAVKRISESYVPWQENSFPGLLGNVVPGRIANRLNLGGTNCAVDAACASSLGAVHLSILELLTGRSDMVITGGADTLNDIFMHMCFSQTGVLSHTGDVRPFSKDADGTVLGEGIGMLVLKRLEDAEKDRDKIYCVIKAIGSSSDGRSGSIYAPNAKGQEEALRMAYENAQVEPSTIELLEAHGTGTRVGDAVEFKALKNVFDSQSRDRNTCALGSVKSMIGHTKASAGAAGLIKAALCLHHKVIPPTLKAEEPDPDLNINESPFYLSSQTKPWVGQTSHPRRAGVSAFGFGGSNFHVVLEEYEREKKEPAWDGSVEIFALSTSGEKELLKKLRSLKQFIVSTQTNNPVQSGALSFHASTSRQTFSAKDPYRFLLILTAPEYKDRPTAEQFDQMLLEIQSAIKNKTAASLKIPNAFFGGPDKPGKLAFIFPGQGSQYTGMGKDLSCIFPEGQQILEKAGQLFSRTRETGDQHLSEFIYPLPVHLKSKTEAEESLRQTDIAQPAIGAVSLLMLKILEKFGLRPELVCGHSFGELSALLAAGSLDADSFLSLSVERGKHMAQAGQKNGAMLAVQAPLDEISAFIRESGLDIVLANRNSHTQGVLSGPADAVHAANALCRQKGLKALLLPVSAAFHSHLVKDALLPFKGVLNKIDIHSSQIPVFSNTTAAPYPALPEEMRALLGDQLIHPVNFVQEIEAMYAEGGRTFVEVGPKPVLTGLVKSILKENAFQALPMDSASGKSSGIADLAKVLCQLAALGYPVLLEKWEGPSIEPKKQKMQVMISGANHRSYRKPEVAAPLANKNHENAFTPGKTPEPGQTQKVSMEKEMIRQTPDIQHHVIRPTTNEKPMNLGLTPQPEVIADALKIIQEGLRSMQDLQTQTAEAHKKFLDNQTEASRTIRLMMEKAERMTEAVLGLPPVIFEESLRQTISLPPLQIKTSPEPKATKVNPPKPEIIVAAQADPERTSHEMPPEQPSSPLKNRSTEEIKNALFTIVSQLTGYPMEMLDREMDIEADLGIDSIKRVEILSAFEEKIPDLPLPSPGIMGEMKTLGQIIAYFDGATGNVAPSTGRKILNETDSGFNSDGCGSGEIEAVLYSVVSQLTGYPLEMLDPNMEIEADLGIDSIKRVEILSAVEEKVPNLPAFSPEKVGELKTLRDIVFCLATPSKIVTPPPIKASSSLSSPERDIGAPAKTDERDRVQRNIVSMVEAPFVESLQKISIPQNRPVLILADKSGLGEAIAKALNSRQIDSKLIAPDASKTVLKQAGGLILISQPDQNHLTERFWIGADEQFLKDAFEITRKAAPFLLESAENGGALFATITHLDGRFGFKGIRQSNPIQGGLSGLAKTAALEWETVSCHALDVSPEWKDNTLVAETVVSELLNGAHASPVEIGLDFDNGRFIKYIPELKSVPFPTGDIRLNPGEVVVITGGARGVTAACALAIARKSHPVVVLLGRSPQPSPEPEWLMSLTGEVEIKKAILDNEFSGEKVTPVKLEKAFRTYTANREIVKNLERLRATGSTAVYHPVDVRDEKGVQALIEQVRKEHGPVKCIVHGAGVVEDRLIKDKTLKQFETVFDTKVSGLKTLLKATLQDNLKYLVLFSSVSARQGNKGQADYAMANEALNKIAQRESTLRDGCRVISINWGPWDGGMVTPSLKKEFTRNHIQLIPLEEGADCMLSEMRGDDASPVEVVIGAGLTPSETQEQTRHIPQPTQAPSLRTGDLSLSFQTDITIHTHPILAAHVLNGIPVVPFALMAEWLGHSALHENPGLQLHGIDDMRVLSGIKLDSQKKAIRLFAGKAWKKGPVFEVDVEIRNGGADGAELIHSRARVILADAFSSPPRPKDYRHLCATPYSESMEEVYDKILFHGIPLQGLKEVIGSSSKGMVAKAISSPPPEEWIATPLRSRWLGDPLVLDSAFQLAVLWCFQETGNVSLPSYSAGYRQYRSHFPQGEITVILEVEELTSRRMKGDFTFLDSNGAVVARMTGYEAVIDASLLKAFKPGGIKRKHLIPA